MSKPFGLGGLRIGWLISRDPELRERIAAHRDYTTISVPTLSDALATIAIGHATEILRTPLRNVRLPEAEHVRRTLAEQGVLVVPGALFGHPDRVRIGLAGPPVDVASGLAQLELVA